MSIGSIGIGLKLANWYSGSSPSRKNKSIAKGTLEARVQLAAGSVFSEECILSASASVSISGGRKSRKRELTRLFSLMGSKRSRNQQECGSSSIEPASLSLPLQNTSSFLTQDNYNAGLQFSLSLDDDPDEDIYMEMLLPEPIYMNMRSIAACRNVPSEVNMLTMRVPFLFQTEEHRMQHQKEKKDIDQYWEDKKIEEEKSLSMVIEVLKASSLEDFEPLSQSAVSLCLEDATSVGGMIPFPASASSPFFSLRSLKSRSRKITVSSDDGSETRAVSLCLEDATSVGGMIPFPASASSPFFSLRGLKSRSRKITVSSDDGSETSSVSSSSLFFKGLLKNRSRSFSRRKEHSMDHADYSNLDNIED